MKKLKLIMAIFAALIVFLMVKLSVTESTPLALQIQPVAHPQPTNTAYQAYPMEEEMAFQTQNTSS